MSVELFKRDLAQLMKSIPGLLAILIIDRDGVPLIEAHQELVPELAMRPSFLSTTVLATDQAGKLGFGKCNTISCDYGSFQVVSFNKVSSALMVTLIADSKANTGMLLSLYSEFDLVVNELRKIKV